jgi:hypothetical protein
LKDSVKRGLRAYGVSTSFLRGFPDFIIIGAKRGGTTSLYRAMTQHPRIAPLFPGRQKIKGTYFFDNRFDRGMAWYRSHFPTSLHRRLSARARGFRPVTGEASPYYLAHPLAPYRAAGVVPHARLIVLLRDPVARAHSHYREQVRRGFEDLSFEEAIEEEPKRLDKEVERLLADPHYYSYTYEHHSYVTQGQYAEQLTRWLEGFRRDQLLVLLSEDFYADPSRTVNRVFEFIGLPPARVAVGRFNFHPGDPMLPETRERLLEHFRPYNKELTELLDTDFSRWGSQPAPSLTSS